MLEPASPPAAAKERLHERRRRMLQMAIELRTKKTEIRFAQEERTLHATFQRKSREPTRTSESSTENIATTIDLTIRTLCLTSQRKTRNAPGMISVETGVVHFISPSRFSKSRLSDVMLNDRT